jgi:phosphonate transport system substrate-binding protein
MRSFKMLAPDVQNQLRILWTSEVLPPFPFTAHSRVPKEVVAKLQKVMQEMDKNPQGVELLKAINFKGIDSANDSSYNGMRKLKLKLKAPVQPPAASN